MSDSPTPPPFAVRAGSARDLPAVFSLVEELAAHVRSAGEVATSPEVFAADLAAGWFDLLVAEETGTGAILGMMIYYRSYSTWKGRMTYLEDFAVTAGARRRGVGRALWSALVATARTNGSTSVKWQIAEFNDGAKAFYREMGASIELGYENGRLYL